MKFKQRKVKSVEEAISIAQKCLHDSRLLTKLFTKVELNLEGMWEVEIELPFEEVIAKVEIDSGTAEITGFQIFKEGE